MANSQLVSHLYDPAGNQTALTNKLLGASAYLSCHTATYDPVGNRLGVMETIDTEGGFGVSYTYDAANLINDN